MIAFRLRLSNQQKDNVFFSRHVLTHTNTILTHC